MTVPVELIGLFIDPGSGSSIVLLGDRNEVTQVLPIFIGPAEASSIALALQGLTPPRPGTHDLMVDLIALLDGRLDMVTVTGLVEGTFLAELSIETPAGPRTLSSRPSDGIALAVRLGVTVHVSQTVLDEAGVEVEREPNEPFADEEIEGIVAEFQKFLATAEPEDFVEPEETDQPEDGDG